MKKTRTATIKQPAYTTRDLSEIRSSILFFVSKLLDRISSRVPSDQTGTKKNLFKNKKTLIPVAILLVIIGIVVITTSRVLIASTKPSTDSRVQIKGARSTTTLNKELQFPLTDSKGQVVTKFKYTIESAELRDEIIVKGTRAVAVKGRVFLILTIKIVNEYDKAIQINTRDYIRLSTSSNQNELIAADIHNDPVSVQAISAKTTRLGFPINENDTNLVLKVGEIKGTKEDIALNFN